MSLVEVWNKKGYPGIRVSAVRLNEDNAAAVAEWCRAELIEEVSPEHPEEKQPGLNVPCSGGMKRASLNMYVVRYGSSFFVSHNRPFELKYEPSYRSAPPLESAGDAAKERGFADPWGGSNAG